MLRFTILLLLFFVSCTSTTDEEDKLHLPSKVVVGTEDDPGTHIEVNAYFYNSYTGEKVSAVNVSWKSADVDYEIESDEDGHIYIIGFRPGEHKLLIQMDGYENAWYCMNLKNVTQVNYTTYKRDVRIPLTPNTETLETTLYLQNNGFDVPIEETAYQVYFYGPSLSNGDEMEYVRKRVTGYTVNGKISVSSLPNQRCYVRAYHSLENDVINFYEYGLPDSFPSAIVRSQSRDRIKLLSTSVSTNFGVGLENVSTSADIVVNFSEIVLMSNSPVVRLLRMDDGSPIATTVTWSNVNQTVTLNPFLELEANTHYLLLLDDIYPINGEYWQYSIQCVYILFKTQ